MRQKSVLNIQVRSAKKKEAVGQTKLDVKITNFFRVRNFIQKITYLKSTISKNKKLILVTNISVKLYNKKSISHNGRFFSFALQNFNLYIKPKITTNCKFLIKIEV